MSARVGGGTAGEGAGEAVPVRWARLVGRRWWVGLGAFVLVAGAVAVLLLLTRPVWRGEARLRLSEPPPPPSVSPSAGVLSLLRAGGDPFANDLELLGSRTVAEEVTEALALDARLLAPREWYRDSLFVALQSTRQTDEALFELTWEAEDRIRVDRLDPEPAGQVASGPAGSPLRFGGLVVVPRARRPDGPASVRLRTIPFGEAAESFRSAVSYERSRRDAYVLDLEYDHADPGVAEEAVALTVTRFVEMRGDLYGRESGTTMDSLRVVVDQTQAELAEAEEALQALQRESGLVAPEVQAEAYVTRWVEVQGELERARAELALVEGALERMEAAPTSGEAWTVLLAHPPFLQNSTLGDLLHQILELEERRLALRSRRSEESLEYRVLDEQIRFLDRSLRSLARSHATSLRASVEDVEARERRLAARLDGLPAATIEVGSRMRDVELLTGVLVSTEQRLRQEEVRSALAFANIQVVDPPALFFEPVWPREKLGAAVGLMLALGTGLMTMVVVDRADTRVRRVAEVRELTGAPVLATPVRPAGGPVMAAGDVEAIRRALPAAGGGVVVCGLEAREDAELVARALGGGSEGWGDVRPVGAVAAPDDVAQALGRGSPRVVLVVRCRRTRRGPLRRATAVLNEAGSGVTGSVLLCGSRAEAEAAWT